MSHTSLQLGRVLANRWQVVEAPDAMAPGRTFRVSSSAGEVLTGLVVAVGRLTGPVPSLELPAAVEGGRCVAFPRDVVLTPDGLGIEILSSGDLIPARIGLQGLPLADMALRASEVARRMAVLGTVHGSVEQHDLLYDVGQRSLVLAGFSRSKIAGAAPTGDVVAFARAVGWTVHATGVAVDGWEREAFEALCTREGDYPPLGSWGALADAFGKIAGAARASAGPPAPGLPTTHFELRDDDAVVAMKSGSGGWLPGLVVAVVITVVTGFVCTAAGGFDGPSMIRGLCVSIAAALLSAGLSKLFRKNAD